MHHPNLRKNDDLSNVLIRAKDPPMPVNRPNKKFEKKESSRDTSLPSAKQHYESLSGFYKRIVESMDPNKADLIRQQAPQQT